MSVTIVTPTIAPRATLLARAMASVSAQYRPADAIAIAYDIFKQGAWHTRQRALDMVTTPWVAFLDDDDELLPQHIIKCWDVQAQTDADVVVPWYHVIGGEDPVPGHRWLTIDPANLHSFGITCLVRTDIIRDNHIKFHPRSETGVPEDWNFWLQLAAAGAKFIQTPEITWKYHHHGDNTSGLPDRWT